MLTFFSFSFLFLPFCSEKARIPAWTDRILRKGSILRQLSYDSAPLRFSDHRPVYATFECKVNIINEERRENISRELYQRRKADIGDATAHLGEDEDSDDEDLIGYDSVEPGLPPASSDRQKWWLDNRQPARAQLVVPNGRDGLPMGLNPHRPSNPFVQTDEPDWVSVPRSSPGYSSVSSSPHEKAAHLPTAPAARQGQRQQIPRKQLPPPFDASKLPAQVGRLMKVDDEDSVIKSHSDTCRKATQTPPAPPPRRRQTAGSRPTTWGRLSFPEAGLDRTQPSLPSLPTTRRSTAGASTASQVSQLSQQLTSSSGKSPPPVGKKPAHLALSKTVTGSTTSRLTRSDGATSSQPPLLPARSASGASQAAVARQQQQSRAHSGTGPGPSSHAGSSSASASVDLLDSLSDGGEEGMGGWEALQPNF